LFSTPGDAAVFHLDLHDLAQRRLLERPHRQRADAQHRQAAQEGHAGHDPRLGNEDLVAIAQPPQPVGQIGQGALALHLLQGYQVRAARSAGADGPGHGRQLGGIALRPPARAAVFRVLQAGVAVIEEVLHIIGKNVDAAAAGRQEGEPE
jgi:hypothetical protein